MTQTCSGQMIGSYRLNSFETYFLHLLPDFNCSPGTTVIVVFMLLFHLQIA